MTELDNLCFRVHDLERARLELEDDNRRLRGWLTALEDSLRDLAAQSGGKTLNEHERYITSCRNPTPGRPCPCCGDVVRAK